MPNYIDEVSELIKSNQHQDAVSLCDEKVRSDPWDTEAQDQMVRVFIDFISRSSGESKTRLHMLATAMQYGRRIKEVSRLYFVELERYLKDIPRQESPGKLVIGLGPGRNGSTSLAALLATAPSSFCTHEVRPMIYLPPTQEQIQFHLRRINALRQHYALVSDTSHWMLYIRAELLTHFPDVQFIVLKRPTKEIVDSFQRIKRNNNHWQAHDGEIWSKTYWDKCYPNYPANPSLPKREQRTEQISRYVEDYYELCDKLPSSNCMHITLDEFSREGGARVGEYLDVELAQEPVHKNQGGTVDSTNLQQQEF